MPTVNSLAAKITRDAATSLEKVANATPPDKQVWKPLDEGRTALDQVAECAVINAWCTNIMTQFSVPELDGEAYGAATSALDTMDKALEALRTETEKLAQAIEAVPADKLETEVKFPWDEKPSTLAEAMVVPHWNMVYHIGQISYIQTLYGDKN
jgi:hypothetical protein